MKRDSFYNTSRTKRLFGLKLLIALLFMLGTASASLAQNCTVNAGVPQTVCESETLTLYGGFTGVSGGAFYWQQISGPSVIIDDPGAQNTTITGISGPSTLGFRFYSRCGDGSIVWDEVTHNILPITDADAGPDDSGCPGIDVITMMANAPGTGESGNWTIIGNPRGVTVNEPTNPNTTLTLDGRAYGIATLVWSISSSQCATSDTVIITNCGGETPISANRGGNDTVWLEPCYTLYQSFWTDASFGGTCGGTGGWVIISGPNIPYTNNYHNPNATFSNLIEGTYVIEWCVSGPCVNGCDQLTIIVPPPVGAVTNASASGGVYCEGITEAILTGNAPTFTGEDVLWTQAGGPACTIENPTDPITAVTGLDGSSTYTFTYTISNIASGCSSDASAQIRYTAAPTISLGVDQILSCGETEAYVPYTFTGTGPVSWQIIEGPPGNPNYPTYPTGWNNAGSSPSLIPNLTVGGSYIVLFRKVESVGTGCANVYDAIVLTVSTPPSAANAGSDQLLACNVDTTFLVGNDPSLTGGGSGTWYQVYKPVSGNDAIIHDRTNFVTKITNLSNGIYIFRWLITGGGPTCPNSQDDVVVAVANTTPTVANAGPPDNICYGTPYQLQGNSVALNEVGIWTASPSSGVTFSDPNDHNPWVDGLSATTSYTFTWTITNACGVTSDNTTITTTATEGPPAADAGADLCYPSGTTVITLAGSDPLPGSGMWYSISGPAFTFDDATDPNTNINITGDGTFVLEWVTSYNACADSRDTVELTVSALPSSSDAGPDQILCGDSTDMAAVTPIVGSGVWRQIYGPPGFTMADSTLASTRITGLFDGVYGFLWTVTNGVCYGGADTVEITVSLPPDTALAGPDQFICGANTTTMAANTILVGSSFWTMVDGPNTPTFDPFDPATAVSNMIMGTYVFTWNSIKPPFCPASIDTVQIEVVPLANVINSLEYCDTTSVALYGNVNSVGYWEQVILGTEPTITVNTTGNSTAIADSLIPGAGFTNYAFRYVIDYPGCTSADTTYITIYETPSPAAAGSDQEHCDETTFTMAGTLPASGTGSWSILSGPGSGSFVNPLDPLSDFTGAVPGIYIFLWSVENGVCSNADPIRVDNYAPPTIADATTVPYQNYYCDSSIFMLGNLPTEGVGEWTQKSGPGAAQIVSPILPNTEIRGLSSGTWEFYWTITNGPVCPPSIDSCTIIIATLPSVPDAGPDQEICEVAPVQTNMAGNVIAIGLGNWTQFSGPSIATIASPNSNTTLISDMIAGLYEFVWAAATDSCTYSDTMQLLVYELPTIAEAGPDSTICISDAVSLYADPASIGTGTWTQMTGPTTASFVDPNSAITGVYGLTNGVYKFEWRTINGPCVESYDSVQITISPIPTFAIAGPDQQECEQDSVRLAANQPTVGVGTWTQVGGPPCVIQDPSLYNTDILFLQYGTSTFRWTITSGACNNFDEIEIIRYQLPSMSDAGPDQALCSNETISNLEGNIPLVGNGLWTQVSGPPANIVIPASPTTEVNNLSPGTFEFLWTISTPGVCPNSRDTVRIDVTNCAPEVFGANGFPVVNGVISGLATCTDTDLDICIEAVDPDGDPLDITSVTILSGSGSTWSDPIVGDTCFTYEPAAGYSGPELLEVVVCDNGAPADCDTVIISLTVSPATLAYAGADVEICETDSYTVSDATATNYSGLGWNTSGDGTFNDAALLHPTYTPGVNDIATGTVTLTLTAFGTGGCADATDDMTIIITPVSTAYAGSDAEICETATYLIADATASSYDTIFWTTSGTGTFSDPNIINPVYTPSANDINDGFVVLTLSTGNGVCAMVADDMTLSITPTATANAGADVDICETLLAYQLADALAEDYDSLLWVTNGDGTFDDEQILNPLYTLGATDISSGSVTLTLTAYGAGSCIDAVDAMVLNISLQPIAAAGPDDEICESDGNYALTNASSTNATSVLWTTDGTGTYDDPSLDNPVYTPSLSDIQDGQVILSMTAFGDGICPDANDFMILTIWPEAIVYAGKDDTICEGRTFQPLDADAQYHTSLLWTSSGDGTFSDATLLHPVYTPGPLDIAAGTVTLTITATPNGTCPNVSDDLVLIISTPPTAYAGADAEICETGVYGLLDATATDYTSLLWTTSGTGSFNDATIQNPVYTPSQNDIDDGFVILTLTAYGDGYCQDESDDMTLTITAQPVVYAGADAAICATNASYSIPDATAEDYSSIEWSTSGDGSFDDINIINPTYTIGANDILSGSVYLILTAYGNASCPDAVDTMELSISPQPTAFAGPDDEICETQTTYTLSSAVVSNATSILWTTDGTGTFDDPSIPNPTYTPSASDIQDGQIRLSVTAYGDGICPDAVDDMLLTIWHLAEVFAGIDATICEGEDYQLWDAYTQYYTALLWTTAGDGTFDNNVALNPVYTPGPNDISGGAVVLTLTATSEGVCPSVSDDMTLNINLAPVAFAGADAEVCEYDTYEIIDATASNYSALLWTSAGDGFFNDASILNPIYTPGPGDIVLGYAALTLTAYGNTPCGDTSDVLLLTITTAPTVYAGPDDEICETAGSYTLADATASDYAGFLWTTSGDGTFDDDAILNPTYTPGTGDIANGLVTLTITAYGNGSCLDESDNMELSITLAPMAYAGPDAEICETDTFNLEDATADNFVSLLWTTSGDGVFSDPTILNPTYYPGNGDIVFGSAFLSLTAYGNGSCADSTDTMILSITAAPYAYAGVDAHICETETYVLIDADAEDYAYLLWTTSGDGTFSDAGILHPEYYPGISDILDGGADLALTAYGLGSCDDASDTMTLTISSLPFADAGPDGEMCSSQISYILNFASAENYTSILWTSDGTGTFSANNIINPSYFPSPSDVENGQVELTLTAYGDGYCPDDEDFMVLTIWKAAEVYAGADAETCEGNDYWILDATAENYESLVWTTSGDGVFDDATLLSPVYTPGTTDIANGSVSLILTADGMGICPPVSDTLMLSVTALPEVDAGPDEAICETDVYTVAQASADNYSNFGWTSSGDGTFDDPSILLPVYTPGTGDINTGTVVLSLTAYGNGSCPESTDVMILTISGAAIANAGGDRETCEGNTFYLENAFAENYASIIWSTSGDGSFDDLYAMNPVYTPGSGDISSGSVTLTMTAIGIGSCEDMSNDMILTITEAAQVYAGGNADICETDTYELLNASASGYGSIIWSTSGDGTFSNSNLVNPIYFPGPIDIQSGGAILVITAEANGSCEDISDAMNLQIHSFPTAEAGDAGVICYGTEFQITDADAENFSSLLWTTSGDGTFSDEGILEPVYYAGPADLADGYADLTLTAYGFGSCGYASDIVVVLINASPIVDAGGDHYLDEGEATQLHGNASGGSGDYLYFWTPADYIINSFAQNPTTFPIFQDTEFILTVTDNLTGCKGRDTVMVYVEGPGPDERPIAVDDYDTTFVNVPIVIPILDNDYIPPNQTITAYLCGGPFNGIATVNSNNTVTYTPDKNYSGDDSLCYYICTNDPVPLCDTAMVYIHVLPLENIEDNIIIYNGFTPNDDGINDKWKIDGIELYPDNDVLIFNRWGDIIREIYSYDNVDSFWDGTNKENERMPDGTYYYVLQIRYDGQDKKFSGWIYVHGTGK